MALDLVKKILWNTGQKRIAVVYAGQHKGGNKCFGNFNSQQMSNSADPSEFNEATVKEVVGPEAFYVRLKMPNKMFNPAPFHPLDK